MNPCGPLESDMFCPHAARRAAATGSNRIDQGRGKKGNQTTRVVVRAIGPFLGQFGVPDPLADPTLEVRDSNGGLLVSNNNCKTRDSDGSSQEAQIQATGLAPGNDFESAVELTLPPGSYTGIVRGANNGTGNGLVEAYNLQ